MELEVCIIKKRKGKINKIQMLVFMATKNGE